MNALTQEQVDKSVEVTFDKDDNTIEITGILKDAKWSEGSEGRRYLSGIIYRDRYGRWPDGTLIFTTYVKEEVAPEVFKTRSDHNYRVETWQEEPAN